MTLFARNTQSSQGYTKKLALFAIGFSLVINVLLVFILYKLQQTELNDKQQYALRDISTMDVNPQRLKLPEPKVLKPKKQKKIKPKLIKKNVVKKKPPPINPMKMQPLALSMNMRLLPMPKLTTAVVVPTKVVEEPVEQPEIQEGDGGIYEVGMVDNPPQPLAISRPVYPTAAKRLGLEGWVEVAFVVDETGKVNKVDIVNSSSRRFHQAAQSAVYTWRFKPAVKDRREVSVLCRQKLKFDLQN